MEEIKITFYRHAIHEFSFTALEGKDKWTAYKFVKSVYRTWMPTHLARLCSVIDALPADLSFELSQQSELRYSEQTGLSQNLANHNLSGLSARDNESQMQTSGFTGDPRGPVHERLGPRREEKSKEERSLNRYANTWNSITGVHSQRMFPAIAALTWSQTLN